MKPRTGPTSTLGARCFGGEAFAAGVFLRGGRAVVGVFLRLARVAGFFFEAAGFLALVASFPLAVFFLLAAFFFGAFLLLADFFVTFFFETFLTGAFLAEVFFDVFFFFDAAAGFRACFLAALRATFLREAFFAAFLPGARAVLPLADFFFEAFLLPAAFACFLLLTAFFAAINSTSATVENQARDYTCAP